MRSAAFALTVLVVIWMLISTLAWVQGIRCCGGVSASRTDCAPDIALLAAFLGGAGALGIALRAAGGASRGTFTEAAAIATASFIGWTLLVSYSLSGGR